MFPNLDKLNKNKIAAWAVHGFTGSGAVLGFLAIIAILNSDAVGAFLWLGLALLIDGLDGTLARKVNVTEQTPNIDGTILDSVIESLDLKSDKPELRKLMHNLYNEALTVE